MNLPNTPINHPKISSPLPPMTRAKLKDLRIKWFDFRKKSQHTMCRHDHRQFMRETKKKKRDDRNLSVKNLAEKLS